MGLWKNAPKTKLICRSGSAGHVRHSRTYIKESSMSKVRVLVGTKKGAFILNSDGTRKKWSVDGSFFAGWEIYHLKGSPIDQYRICSSKTSCWFGHIIQRSDD